MTPTADTITYHLTGTRGRRREDALTDDQRATCRLLRDAARIVGGAALPREYRAEAFRIVAHDLLDRQRTRRGTLPPAHG